MTLRLRKISLIIALIVIVFFSLAILFQGQVIEFALIRLRLPFIIFLNRDVSLAMQIGNYYFGGGAYDLNAAEKAYKNAVAIDPKILWGHYQLARIYFVKGDKNKALEEINNELVANPENLRSLYVRGLIYGYRNLPGDLEKAAEDFEHFTNWAPKEWAGYNDLAWILSKLTKYKEAKDAAQKGIQEALGGKENPWLWNSLGVAQLNLGGYKDAGESFSKAKNLALKLTVSDWRKAYPGNSPDQANNGLLVFRQAIEENLKKSRRVDN